MNTAADSTQRRRQHRETENRQLVSLFTESEVFLGDFIDTSTDGIGAEFETVPAVELGELVRVMVCSRLRDAIVRQIRRIDESKTFLGLEIVDTLA